MDNLSEYKSIRDHAMHVAKSAEKYYRPPNEIPFDTRGTLKFGERLGLVFVTQTAFLSLFSVGILLFMIVREVIKRWHMKRLGWPPQIYMYFVSLLVSDFMQALGSIMNIRWIHDAGIVEGSYCTAQGAIKTLGDVGVAFATIAIAVHTFGIIVGRWSRIAESPYVGIGVVGTIWVVLILDVSVAVATHKEFDEPIYGNTQYWCSIRSSPYLGEFIAMEYVWLWIALASSFVLYTAVAAIVYREYVLADNTSAATTSSRGRQVRKLAFQMVFYPIIYSVTILPQSIVRFIQFAHPHHPPPFGASAFAAVTFASSGLMNTMLYAYTRPSLLPHNPEDDFTAAEKFPANAGLDTEFQSDYNASIQSHSRPHSMHSGYGTEYSRNSRYASGQNQRDSGLGSLED